MRQHKVLIASAHAEIVCIADEERGCGRGPESTARKSRLLQFDPGSLDARATAAGPGNGFRQSERLSLHANGGKRKEGD